MPKAFTDIAHTRPDSPLLDLAADPYALRELSLTQLPQVADELREQLLYSVGQTGGHFGAGLGVVELTVALHYVLNTPEDRLVWDVGHQAYPHKLLTGRREQMLGIRKKGGLSGFPKRDESAYDTFGVGHSSTSISAALGMALAFAQKQQPNKVAAVIGDGAMTAGMAFEALNHAAHTQTNMLVVLNDNNMSISHNVGGLASYFAKIWASKFYNSVRESGKKVLSVVPSAMELARKTEEHMKGFVSPATLFEELGFNYVGPIDGHDLETLVPTLQNQLSLPGPQLLHVITKKGKGFVPAEKDPVNYHAISPIQQVKPAVSSGSKSVKYQTVFGDWLCDMAEQDSRVIGITPAMSEGSGMVEFSQTFPERFHDVAIAEQHAVTLAAGLACEGMKPVVAIYSTFLQRAYDQLVHDVALQNLDVLFAIDRAGLVGEDGATHAGTFDLAFMRTVPNMVVMTPADENETRRMLYTGHCHKGPAAVRYPRGTGPGVHIEQDMKAIRLGQSRTMRQGEQVAILSFGVLLPVAMQVAEKINATVVDMRFVKPLDQAVLETLCQSHTLLVTLEDHAVMGGAGSAVNEWLADHSQNHLQKTAIINCGLPDTFMSHGTRSELLADAGLDMGGVLSRITSHRDYISHVKQASSALGG